MKTDFYPAVVIGAGAGGYTAAITLAEAGVRVLLCDSRPQLLHKVSASGNGRCNLSNQRIDPSCYVSQTPEHIPAFLGEERGEVSAFWRSMGLLTATEEGRIYPFSRRASEVCRLLSAKAEQLSVEVLSSAPLSSITPSGKSWLLQLGDRQVLAQKVILAMGSPASPSLGGQDNASLLTGLGHRMVSWQPALVSLATNPRYPSLKGLRTEGVLTLHTPRGETISERGEILFTDYGLSGVAVMQLSAHGTKRAEITLDLLPDLSPKEVTSCLFSRLHQPLYGTVDKLLLGWIDHRMAYAILKSVGISPLSLPSASLSPEAVRALSRALKGWHFAVEGTQGFASAHAARGGVSLEEVDPHTLESNLAEGVYVVGELLDLTGLCGGYNLHWAWLSGLRSARALLKSLRK
ncbi:MAG: aminoacetone oxidase family FAD-binding enzyme [Clostridia bacterium]|nr:aminoacetone oxidase family FAD-binding enzyme [Clostridia bacterium]